MKARDLGPLALWVVASLVWPCACGAVSLSSIASFEGTNGSLPYASLVQGSNGNLYGTTYSGGGSNNLGTVFEITTNGSITVIYSFSGNDGANPRTPLLLASDGLFYGTTVGGGSNGLGTVFQISAGGQFTNLFNFNGTNGAAPLGALIQAKDGNIYGTTSQGGTSNGQGTVFMLGSNGLVTLYTFESTNGADPIGALAQGNDGNFYGVTGGSGPGFPGTIFRMSPNGSLTNLYAFTNMVGPQAGLVLDSDGNFYGTTQGGGTNGSGTVFQLTSAGNVNTLFSFAGTNGSYPEAPLIQGADGNFYGTTTQGGANGYGNGSVFSITSGGALTTLFFFPGGNFGADPQAALVQGSDGNFYGTTYGGGRGDDGTVFKLSGFPPFISVQPSSQTLVSGSTAVFAVSAGGAGPLFFQWQFNSNNLSAGGNISGSATATLTISNVTAFDSGTNWVIVSNSGGSITSNPVTLTVVNPPILTITSPSSNARLPQSMITASGRVGDNVPVESVYCQLDNQGWVLATSPNAWTNWSARFSVFPGSNTLQAFALNSAGIASPTSSVTFFSTTLFSPAKGNYTGLFYDETNGVSLPSSGYFTMSATAQGTFSGSLELSGRRYPFHGAFGTNGTVTLAVPRGAEEPLTMALTLDLTQGTGQMTGLIGDSAWTAQLLGNRAVFNSTTNPAPFKGKYTLVIQGADDSTNGPGGDGYGTLSVSESGKISFSGSLADGTQFSQSATVAQNGQWPFFKSLYNGQGSILGWLAFTNAPSAGLGGSVTWIKQAQPKAKVYPAGFTNETSVVGSAYARTNGFPILNLTNAMLVLSGGGLAQSVTNAVNLGTGSRAQASNPEVHLNFSLGAGSFSGEVGNAGTEKPLSFHGVVLQNLGEGSGYFLNTNQSGEIRLEGQ